MATCLRECEACQYGKTCPISCRYEKIIAREHGGKRKDYGEYTTMTDGIKTFVRYGRIPTASLFGLCKHGYINHDDDLMTGVEIWDDILDSQTNN